MPKNLPFNHPTESVETVLYESKSTRIVRVQSADGRSVIHKEQLRDCAVARTRHERRILELLSHLSGVPRLVQDHHAVPANILVLEDLQCQRLEEIYSPQSSTQALTAFALQVTRLLLEVHQAGVMHKDITPSNILITGKSHQPILIDYNLATTFAEERPPFVHHREIAGTLPYMAPEQTGRTGRSVDQRIDLYSLGATLYELACGHPPFSNENPLQLIHDILAREPNTPIACNPTLAPAFSAIIMKLLNKEPDQRYQSADGLLNDLTLLSHRLAHNDGSLFELGMNDFPARLLPPTRLIGRDHEVATLKLALEEAINTPRRGLLITGPSGVGKTALINELRPLVSTRRGWFISGKFDQYHEAADAGPISQVVKSLSHLLLVDTESDMEAQRARLLSALGANAGLMAASNPQMARFLGIEPELLNENSLLAGVRKQRAVLDMLRTVAEPKRPVVIILDDLQWADANSLEFINLVITDPDIRGLLLIGAYRETELDATHPLSAILKRWRQMSFISEPLRLHNLSPESLTTLLAEMLRLPPENVASLSEVVVTHTAGNPYDTVELINALRHDRLLIPVQNSWEWQTTAVRQHVGANTVMDFLTTRISRLPAFTQALMEIIACLGSDTPLSLLAITSDCTEQALETGLLSALEDGLLILKKSQVTFRHDRVQKAVYRRMTVNTRLDLKLQLARRLAKNPTWANKAAELYLATVTRVTTVVEQRLLIDLFFTAAHNANALLVYTAAENYARSALTIMDSLKVSSHDIKRRVLEKLWHTLLIQLGRLEEADTVFYNIESRHHDSVEFSDVVRIQLSSLLGRNRIQEALTLGFTTLANLGIQMASDPVELDKELNERYAVFCQWLQDLEHRNEVNLPECQDARICAIAKLIDILIAGAFFCGEHHDHTVIWLVLTAHRLWIEHGPCAELLCPISHAAFATILFKADYLSGYHAMQHILAVAQARRYSNELPRANFIFVISGCFWFESTTNILTLLQKTYESLLQFGDFLTACHTLFCSVILIFECNPLLEVCQSEIDKAISFIKRTGSVGSLAPFIASQYLIDTLTYRGEENPLTQTNCDWKKLIESSQHVLPALSMVHGRCMILSIIFGDTLLQSEHSAALMTLLPHSKASIGSFMTYLFRSLALTALIRQAVRHQTPAAEIASFKTEFQACRAWLKQRSEEAPKNFLHMLHWIDGEYAAATGDFHRAVIAFEKLLSNDTILMGWYKPVITERAGLFYLENDLNRLGLSLLRRARDYYDDWGAIAKVKQLNNAYDLQASQGAVQPDKESTSHPLELKRYASVIVGSDSIDMLAILRASQMLSSETNLARLEIKVVELLGSLTGATKVLLILRNDKTEAWTLRPSPTTGNPSQSIPIEQAGEDGLMPLSVFQFALRHQEPLLVKDVSEDERCANDPYFKSLKYCSLMVVPIFSHGDLRAMLMLENHLSRGVFQSNLLNTVTLIAGQLAVSLENAHLYASLEDKVAERTQALEQANRSLENLSITDALTGLPNRRRFTDVMESEWLRAQRTQCALSVGLIDIDQFKHYNDHYGHQQGDTCLRQVAQALKANLRKDCDLVARYGGEEFVLVLPYTPLEGALTVAEHLRATVEALQLPHELNTTGIVTVSVGIASTIPEAQNKISELIERADKALYVAKQQGRNRVIASQSNA